MKQILFRVAKNKGSILGFTKGSNAEADRNERDTISNRFRELIRV
jgi:hypothetical protein